MEEKSLQAQLEALRQNFIAQLPKRLEMLESGLAKWRSGWNQDDLSEFHRMAHTLTGAGATFGYDELSQVARELEQQLVAPENAKQLDVVESLFDRVRFVIHNTTPDAFVELEVPSVPQLPELSLDKTIYLLDDEEESSRNLAFQLEHFGYEAKCFFTTESLKRAVLQERPSLIVADIILPEGNLAGIDIINDLNESLGEPVPTIFLSSRADFDARLQAVRAGSHAYFTKPYAIESLIDVADGLTAAESQHPFRVLVVDDSEQQAQFYANVLMQAGMEVRVENDPLNVLDAISDYVPELVLMDLYMPHCTGIELAAIIRQQAEYLGLPIIYLSSETDRKVQLEAMRLGGDDFLTKPIKPSELISSIMIRAERYRLISSRMSQDSLTGLLNHRCLMESLQNEMARAKRHGGDISFVMLDIDHFKEINDNYGHAAGDRVIINLARLLKQRLRGTDIIGRYGGEEFGVILPQTAVDEAARVLEEVRAHFATMEHYTGENCFNVTLSGGIAGAPPAFNVSDLLESADQMLYQAKREGRNRIVFCHSNN